MDPNTVRDRHERNPSGPPLRLYRLSEFLASPAVVINGERINRRLVIQFVANKKGGAHFDFTRKKDETAFQLLDKVASYGLANKDAVYFELLSIGQDLARSTDAKRLRELIP
jgi:hypothetical protein